MTCMETSAPSSDIMTVRVGVSKSCANLSPYDAAYQGPIRLAHNGAGS
jgi:hypothetical protein